MPKSYIDIRLEVAFDSETYDLDGETYEERFVDDVTPSVHKVKGLSAGDLQGIAESFAQMDRYQLMLANDITTAISDYADEQENDA